MLRSISRRELIARFHALGFEGPFAGGKHQFMKKGQLKLRIPNPHRNELMYHSRSGYCVKQELVKRDEVREEQRIHVAHYFASNNLMTLASFTLPLPSIATNRAKYTPLAISAAFHSTDLNPAS